MCCALSVGLGAVIRQLCVAMTFTSDEEPVNWELDAVVQLINLFNDRLGPDFVMKVVAALVSDVECANRD